MKTHLNLLGIGLFFAAVHLGWSQTVTFTKITTGAVATDTGQFASAGWGDFANRGLLDLFVCNWEDRTNAFYRNNGDGSFTKVTDVQPVRSRGYHVGPAVADYDNDGNLDLLISAGVGAPAPKPLMLYQNIGNATFEAINGVGLNVSGFFNTCAWLDYDNDGWVDVFVPGLDSRSLLFRNKGDGTFTRLLTNSPPNDLIVHTDSASSADYDDDGFTDLLVNSLNGNSLYRNNRNGTFTRILTNAVATDTWSYGAWGAAWGDYDNDGLLDLFVPGMEMGNRLYHNDGSGVFSKVTSGPMLQRPLGGGSRACAWGDYDNDGYLDLFVSSYNTTNRLFRNNGEGTFTQFLGGVPVTDPGTHFYCGTCGWADYDNDGFLDLFVTRGTDNGGAISNLLFHNEGNSNAWLEVKLIGTVANRSALGAKVRVLTTIGGKTFWQMREISTSGGRSFQPLTVHFGLGDATNVTTLRVEWPCGAVQEFHNVAPQQILTITEPPRLIAGVSNSVPEFHVKGGRGFLYEIQGSDDLVQWSSVATLNITNLDGKARFTDTSASAADRRFYRAISR